MEFYFQLEPILVTYGLKDTFLDIVFDLVGALLVLAFGDVFSVSSRPTSSWSGG